MNMRNNNKLAALALVVTASAIGAGAVVSGNAMAGSEVPDTATDSVSFVSIGAEGVGDAIECSFDGVDLPTLVENASAGLESSSGVVTGEIAVGELGEGVSDMSFEGADPAAGASFSVTVDGVVAEGEALPADAELGELVEEGSADAGSISAATEVLPVGELPEGMQVIGAGDVRQGTADECAEILGGLTAAP